MGRFLAGSFNGLADVVEDRANASTRPIASGRLSNRDALLVVQGAVVLSLALSAAAGITIQAVVFLLLGYAYSGPPFPAKRHWAAASVRIGASGPETGPEGAMIPLTAREQQILAYVAEAMTNQAIGRELGIAESTVKRHLRNIFTKLGASSRMDATQEAGLSLKLRPRP